MGTTNFDYVDADKYYLNGVEIPISGITSTELGFIDGVTAGTALASKAVVLGANKNIDVLAVADLKLGSGAGTSVTSTAAELNVLDGVTRGSIVAGISTGTGVIDAKGDGKILVGDGTDVASVSVSGDATLANTGALTLAVPKVSVISKVCAVADFTDNTNATGYIDFTASSLPAGAIVLGWKAVVTGAFAGDTTAVMQVGVAGTLGKFSASTSGSVFTTGTIGTGAPMDTCFNATASTPRVTVTGGSDFTSIVTNAGGAMTVYLYYIATA